MTPDPERLPVYQTALAHIVIAERIARKAPRGHAALADQLRRASSSIVLNIAEGAGEFSPKEKARFYRLARRSATECMAVEEIYRRLEFADDVELAESKRLLVSAIAQLVGMIRMNERLEA